MKLPQPSPNPRYREFRECLAAHPDWLGPWTGCFFRFQTLQFPSATDILSGEGASRRGGRWNPPGLRAIYGSTTDSAALEEAKANDRYYGIVTKTPRLVVAINASVPQMLDLTEPAVRRRLGLTLAELAAEDWRKLLQAGQESLSQALARAASACGASGVLVRSAAVRGANNVVIFPPLGPKSRLTIVEGDELARLTKTTKT